jgi:hypothetical protein
MADLDTTCSRCDSGIVVPEVAVSGAEDATYFCPACLIATRTA